MPINANDTGMSESIPGIIKIQKTFKVMKSFLFNGDTNANFVTKKDIPFILLGCLESGSVFNYSFDTVTTYSDV